MSSVPDGSASSRTPGPIDPESFYKAQKRNRRATWRMSAVSAFAALIMGIPLTLVLFFGLADRNADRQDRQERPTETIHIGAITAHKWPQRRPAITCGS